MALPLKDESAKEAALLQAGQFAQDEAGAVSFIVECAYADARLKAAQHVHSKPMLEQLLRLVRKTDRRVARLVQARLDDIHRREITEKLARDCIAEGARLAQEWPLMANRVSELDRRWQSVGAVSNELQSEFEQLRGQLAMRLTAQAALQRAVIDTIEKLRNLGEGASMALLPSAELAELEAGMARHRAAPEAASLPPQLLASCEQACQEARGRLVAIERRRAAVSQREQALASWEAAERASLQRNVLSRAWEAMPPLDSTDLLAPLQQRFDALWQALAPQTKQQSAPVAAKAGVGFDEALAAMEQALQEGLLHVASEQDAVLSSISLSARKPDGHQSARLAEARAELKRLQGWARWGGNASRDELISATAALAGQSLPLDDLAKKISIARQQWKALDAVSGAAPKALWEKFDVVCNAAYAPVAEHAKKQSQERRQNRERAQGMLDELRRFADSLAGDSAIDWKVVSAQYRKAQQAWRRLGPIDRKERKILDAEFNALRQRLLEPLREQWDREIARRENMIVEVENLAADDRNAADRVRQLQAVWQESAKQLPLEQEDEQALWQRFRSACDAVFARRRERATAADGQRNRHAQEKESLCAELEASLGQPDASLANLLKAFEAAWARIGPAPRVVEQQLERRYRSAVAAVHAKLEKARSAEQEAQLHTFLEKLDLCQAAEAAVDADQVLDAGWAAHWQMLPTLPARWEVPMRARFDAAHVAWQSGDRGYVDRLDHGHGLLVQKLLRMEILAGIASPPELSQERLQMQVELLQFSLAGQADETLALQLEKACQLTARMDEQTSERLRCLVEKFWRG